jgi:hypothetical protein
MLQRVTEFYMKNFRDLLYSVVFILIINLLSEIDKYFANEGSLASKEVI